MSWEVDTSGLDSPSLTSMVLVPPPGEWLCVGVSPSVRSQDKVAPVLNSLSSVVEGFLPDGVSPWSSHSIASLSELSGSVFS